MKAILTGLAVGTGLLAAVAGSACAAGASAEGPAGGAVPALVAAAPSHAAPAYARWGRLAVEQTMKKYGAGIRDYRYEGAFPGQSGSVEHRFKLVLEPKSGVPAAVVCRVRVEEGRLLEVEWTESAP
ncbi:DUF3889 domain-containing protein [Paenibacillus pasadenensis]|uniref:DUF3889 domain-containing protein n=1 Tax=Paenibacillus pasadenensis TaxID=217090 RepID=A0A2N5N710_9BACL|nr:MULTISPECIES: DUF3889 domain-containing protein [Paenibacillus]PLT46105.1 hypothetical protein B8V81_4536 [Paenibacillus pasadenensis]